MFQWFPPRRRQGEGGAFGGARHWSSLVRCPSVLSGSKRSPVRRLALRLGRRPPRRPANKVSESFQCVFGGCFIHIYVKQWHHEFLRQLQLRSAASPSLPKLSVGCGAMRFAVSPRTEAAVPCLDGLRPADDGRPRSHPPQPMASIWTIPQRRRWRPANERTRVTLALPETSSAANS